MQQQVGDFTDDPKLVHLLSETTFGLPVVTRTLDEIKDGSFLSHSDADAEWRVWRFMAEDEDGRFVAGEVSRADGEPQLVDLSTDPRLAGALRIFHDQQQQESMGNREYEVRLVQVPGALLEYLSYRAGRDHYIIPTLAASKEIDIGRRYSADEFGTVVEKVAKRFRSEQEKTKYPPPAPPPSQESKSK
jgi:hypothetical protein